MSITGKVFAILGCLLLTAAGALGAWGFHGLDQGLSAAQHESWNWAVRMQFYHGLGLLLVGILEPVAGRSALLWLAGALMTAGIVLFSLLIYAGVLGLAPGLGRWVPFGGGCLMLSWLVLAVAVLRGRSGSR